MYCDNPPTLLSAERSTYVRRLCAHRRSGGSDTLVQKMKSIVGFLARGYFRIWTSAQAAVCTRRTSPCGLYACTVVCDLCQIICCPAGESEESSIVCESGPYRHPEVFCTEAVTTPRFTCFHTPPSTLLTMPPAAAPKTALAIIDLQNDFCPPHGSLAVPGGRDLAPIVNKLFSQPFALKVATRDFHPADHISFAAQHAGKEALKDSHTIANPNNSQETQTTYAHPVPY